MGGADVATNFDDVAEGELGQPVTVLADCDKIKVNDLTHLLFPATNIFVNLCLGDNLVPPALFAFARVPSEHCACAKEEDDFMSCTGKIHEFPESDGVAEVKIFECGIKSLVETDFFASN